MGTVSVHNDKFRSWAIDVFLNTSWVDNPDIPWFNDCLYKAITEKYKANQDTPVIIGLCGNAGCGKDTVASYFTSNYLRCTSLAFADPIREIAQIFGFTKEQMSDRTLKETKDIFWGFSPRTFMQKVGTEMFREQLRDDIWIKLAERRIFNRIDKDEVRMVFITDVRFPNEVEAIRSWGGKIVKVHREGFDRVGKDLHPSERFISEIKADLDIFNKASSREEFQWAAAKSIGVWLKPNCFYNL